LRTGRSSGRPSSPPSCSIPRAAPEFDDIREEIEALRTVELSRSTTTAGLNALRALVDRGQHRRVSFRDVLIAASAESRGLGVLHYDQHFDLLAEVLHCESRWIAPRGSL
jgi:predicted nucleic acid-binding protein